MKVSGRDVKGKGVRGRGEGEVKSSQGVVRVAVRGCGQGV